VVQLGKSRPHLEGNERADKRFADRFKALRYRNHAASDDYDNANGIALDEIG